MLYLLLNKQGMRNKKAEEKRDNLAALLELYNRGNAGQGQALIWVSSHEDVWISLKPVNSVGLSFLCHDALPMWR